MQASATTANEEHRAAQAAAAQATAHARRVGEELRAAKKEIRHGGWGEWVRENLDFSKRTADRYMREAARP